MAMVPATKKAASEYPAATQAFAAEKYAGATIFVNAAAKNGSRTFPMIAPAMTSAARNGVGLGFMRGVNDAPPVLMISLRV